MFLAMGETYPSVFAVRVAPVFPFSEKCLYFNFYPFKTRFDVSIPNLIQNLKYSSKRVKKNEA